MFITEIGMTLNRKCFARVGQGIDSFVFVLEKKKKFALFTEKSARHLHKNSKNLDTHVHNGGQFSKIPSRIAIWYIFMQANRLFLYSLAHCGILKIYYESILPGLGTGRFYVQYLPWWPWHST